MAKEDEDVGPWLSPDVGHPLRQLGFGVVESPKPQVAIARGRHPRAHDLLRVLPAERYTMRPKQGLGVGSEPRPRPEVDARAPTLRQERQQAFEPAEVLLPRLRQPEHQR